MTHHASRRGRAAATTAAAALVVLLGSSSDAFASYKVWWFDNINVAEFEEGDISVGNSKLTVPASACGLRFLNPSYYRWMDQYAAIMDSADFSKNVHVWVPKAGCPHNDPFVEYQDGSASFPHPAGASYMEIFTNYGVSWIDANGEQLWCELCPIGGLDYASTNVNEPGTIVGPFATVMAALLDSRQQPFLFNAVATLTRILLEQHDDVGRGVDARRRQYLGEVEATIRGLEDAALSRLYDASVRSNDCQRLTAAKRYRDAFVACGVARDAAADAGSLLDAATTFASAAPK